MKKKNELKPAKAAKTATSTSKSRKKPVVEENEQEMAEKLARADKASTPRPKTRKKLASSANAQATAEELAKIVAQGMFERKAEDIRILDMRNLAGASADFFVISHANSDKQVEAIADSAEDEVQKLTGESPWHREGYENLEWVLLDYIDVVAHVFQAEKREFYAVEELWGDAKEVKFKGK